MNRPTVEEFNPYYKNYIESVSDDVMAVLNDQAATFTEFIKNIPKEKADYAYAPGKWSVKELLGHLIDTERIMAYRALRFARKDMQNLPGFDENDYVRESHYHERSLETLADEFACLRKANSFLFASFNQEELLRQGPANGHPVSVRALLFIMAGHVIHHQNILQQRYM
jgi:hypothetical protein